MAKLKEDLKILIVDDSKEAVSVMRLFLKNKGLNNVYHCEDGDTAMSVVEREKNDGRPIQLIFGDWNMPKMNGLDFLKAIKDSDQYKDIIFIMVTADGEAEKVKEAVKNGVDSFLIKPITADKLFGKIVDCVKKVRRLA